MHAVARLPDNRARIAPHERIAAEMLAPLHGLEEKGFVVSPQFLVGGEGRFKISEDAARNRNQIPLRGQRHKIFQSRRIHGNG